MKKLSQHLQYKHPHLTATKRRQICATVKVTRGRGTLKPNPVSQKQPTILAVLGKEEVEQHQMNEEQEDESEKEQEDDQHTDEGEKQDEGSAQEQQEPESLDIRNGDFTEEVDKSGGEDVGEVEEINSGDDLIEVSRKFSPDHPFLVGLRQHLTSRHGKGRTEREAHQISSEVSKFLSFPGPTLDPKKLYDVQILDKYLKMLESGGRKATTQHSILCRVKQGLTYVNLSLDPVETLKAEKCLKLISNWLSTLGKEARRTKRANLEDLSDRGVASMREIERCAHSCCYLCSITYRDPANQAVSCCLVKEVHGLNPTFDAADIRSKLTVLLCLHWSVLFFFWWDNHDVRSYIHVGL